MIFSRLYRSQDGAAFIELAIVVPLLALLLVGLIETGRYLAFGVRLSNAAHAGAQWGAQSLSNYATHSDDVATAACNDAGFSPTPAPSATPSPGPYCTASTPAPGKTAPPDTVVITSSTFCSSKTKPCPVGSNYIQVNASGTFRPLLNYPIFGKSDAMSAQATQQANP